MHLTDFDHVNIRTRNLGPMCDWYCRILGMRIGARPDFPFPGAWLYLGDRALVHLVGVETPVAAGGDVTLEHFAFRATGLTGFRRLLDRNDIDHSVDPVRGFPIVQINLHDPDGNHIHVDFDRAEVPD